MKRFRHCLLSAVLLSAGGLVVAQDAESKTETQPDGAAPSPGSLFEKLDANSDGKLVKDEIPEEQRRSFERLLRLGDGNDDGELTREEFQKATAEQPAPTGQPGFGQPGQGRPGQGRPMTINAEDFFKRIDRNSDGKLSRDELPEFLRERFGRVIEQTGKDSVTLDEFMKLREQFNAGADGRPGMQGGLAGRAQDPAAAFERLDANGDGKLVLSEVPEQARRFFGPLFERLGRAPEEGVTREEFIESARRAAAAREGQPRPSGQPGPDGRPRPEGSPQPARPGDRRPEGDRPPGDGRPMPGAPGSDEMRRAPRFLGLLDSNRDGRLSRDEVAAMTERFGELDVNGDGQLDPRELFGIPPQGRDGGPQGGQPGMQRRPDMDGRPFDGRPQNRRPEMDRPGDGAADRPGDRPRRPEGDGPRPADGEPRGNAGRDNSQRRGLDIEAIFSRLDRNNDQAISRDEAIGPLQDNFDRVDANGDGKVTADELRQARPRRD